MLKQRTKLVFITCSIFFIIITIIIYPASTLLAAKNALNLCYNALIPALFPFFVFSGLLVSLGIADIASRRLSFVMKPLFGVSGAGAICFILGIVSGYPLGAICACDLNRRSVTTKAESEKLLSFCNNSGPLFILGTVGTAIYHNPSLGCLLYSMHILSAICVGMLFRFWGKNDTTPAQKSKVSIHSVNLGIAIGDVMKNSIKNILLVCGYTVVFSVVISCIGQFGGFFKSPLIAGIMEISTGISTIAASDLEYFSKIILTAFVIGFGGISVHLQVLGVMGDTNLSYKPYIIGKTLQGILCAIFTFIVLSAFGGSDTVFAPNIYPVSVIPLNFISALKLSLFYVGFIGLFFAILMLLCRKK